MSLIVLYADFAQIIAKRGQFTFTIHGEMQSMLQRDTPEEQLFK